MDLIAALHVFHFLRPEWLAALLPLLAAVLWLARRRARDGNWAGLIDPDLIAALRLDRGGPRTRFWPLLALTWALTTIALAGPSWQQDASSGYRASAAWVAVLDLSPSMAATDLTPNRVTRARYALDDLLSSAHDARVGLVAFSDEPYTVTPLTEDVETVRTLLPPLGPGMMPRPGDNLAPALDQAGQLLRQAGARDARVIVLTDGFADPAAAFATAQRLKSQGVKVDVVGIGTAGGAPVTNADGRFIADANGKPLLARLDTDRLKQLAAAGNGRYVNIGNLQSLIGDMQARPETALSTSSLQQIHVGHWRDEGVWILPILLLLVALFWRREQV